MRLAACAVALFCVAACDDGGSDPAPSPVDQLIVDQAVVDMTIAPDMAVVDMAIEPDAMPDMAVEVDMMPGRRPTGIDAPIAAECPARHRDPQVTIEAPGELLTYDGMGSIGRMAPGVFTLALGADNLVLHVPPSADAVLRRAGSFQVMWRQQTRGYLEHFLLLRDDGGKIAFVAGAGTSWMLQQFSAREAVREDVSLAGRCQEAGDRCYDRIDREMIFANANRRRALLPGASSDFTTDGGTFQLHVDQAFQVGCAVLCPNVGNQWFVFWMVRDYPDLMPDFDGDGVLDGDDSCPTVAQPDGIDTDMDGIGDACDQAPNDPGPGLACEHPYGCPSRVCLPDGICQAGAFIVAGAPEVCDGIDNDGNGEADDGLDGCDAGGYCVIGADVAAMGELMRGEPGALVATPTLEGPGCAGVTVDALAWDVDQDDEIDGEGDTLELRRLRGMNPIPVVLRLTDSRGGITEVTARVPVAASEFCP